MSLKVAIYARLSDEDKDKTSYLDLSESIKNQISLATKYAQEQGWVIVDIYSDDDWSGLDRERPEFNRLLRDCQARKVDIVLCKDMSRFTRDKIVTEEYLETKFLEWNVRFIGMTDGSDTADKANKKSREINALVNQWYAEDVSNKVRAAFKAKRQQGSFIGSYAPYGYVKSSTKKGKLEVDREATQIIKRIFSLYFAGNGTVTIAGILNKEGIPNPAAYKEHKNANYKNPFKKDHRGLWSKTSVKRILRNEVYIGNMVQRKNEKLHFKTKKRRNLPKEAWEVVSKTHEPIIDEDIYRKVQEMLDAKVRGASQGKTHLFAGRIYCRDCGSTMVKSSRGQYEYLTCSQYRKKTDSCSRHSIRLDLLSGGVEKRLKEFLSGLLPVKDKLLKQLIKNDNFAESSKMYTLNLNDVKGKIDRVNAALKSLYLDVSQGNLDDMSFNDLKEEFLREKRRLERERNRLVEETKASGEQNNRFKYWNTVIDKFADLATLTRDIVNEFVLRIEVGEKAAGGQEIVIYYSFAGGFRNSHPT